MARIRFACSAGAVFLLLASTACWAAGPFEVSSPSGAADNQGGSPGNLGKLKVKVKAARFLSAGNTVSATRGDIRIRGFDAHMRLNNITFGTARAAGLKASRDVRMPFSKGLEDISNRAALAAVQQPGAAAEGRPAFAGSEGAPMTPEERRQRLVRILRAVMPHIQRRLVMVRLRQQRAEVMRGPPSEAAGEQEAGAQKVEDLQQSNAKLKRVNKLLLMVVRSLIRRSLNLRRQLEAQRSQQPAEGASGEGPSASSEGPDANAGSDNTGGSPSSGESQQQSLARRLILLRQYPPASSSASPAN